MLRRFLSLQRILFALYVLSLATSMSGMELFSTLLAFSVLCLLIARKGIRSTEKLLPPFWKPMLAFLLVVLAGIILGEATVREKLYDIGRMRFFLLYAVLFYYFHYFSDNYGWLKVLFVTTLFVAVYGICQHFIPLDIFRPAGKKIVLYAIDDQKLGSLVLGTFNHHLTFANIYLLYAGLFLALGLFYFPAKKWLLLHGALLCLLCIWTESRAAWIATPVVVAIVASGKSKKVGLIALASVIGVLLVVYATDKGFQQRFQRTFIQQDDFYNLGPRTRLWIAQWHMFKQHPILGVGWNNNERQAKQYVDKLFPEIRERFYGHAHSTPLQILSTTGLLGFGCYLWLWVEIFSTLSQALRKITKRKIEWWLALALLGGFFGFHIQGLTQWNFGDAEVTHNLVFFWAVLAAQVHVRNRTP
ncbi:MAG: O-antigen ligase family protein [Deltaproteobacteria bacterium]|nr:O-antigen ligase family protein [Deltaproteobacteria bacterium]